MKSKFNKTLLKLSISLSLVGVLFYASYHFAFAQDSADKRQEIERQLQQLEKEAEGLDGNIQKIQSEKRTLSSETQTLNFEIKRRELEIKKLDLILYKTSLQIKNKAADIEILSKKIIKNQKALTATLLTLYTYDQDNILSVLIKNRTLSGFLGAINNLTKLQFNLKEVLVEFKQDRSLFQDEKVTLEEFENDQRELKALQEVERRFLAQKKKEKDEILRLTKGKEELFQKLLSLKKRDITALKTQLFYLEKTGVTAEDAIRFADLAAKRTGIRTAFLLALLEVETGKQFEDGQISVGTNLGTGNWRDDLYNCYVRLGKKKTAEAEKKAFFEITGKLNLDPDKVPVSRRYRSGAGCGGAMGPAQFMPTTWLRFEDKVAQLTKHKPPNPWNIEDSFTASAVFLASAGANSQTRAGELAAARIYISGRSTCSQKSSGARYICLSYSKKVLELAEDIEHSIKISFLEPLQLLTLLHTR